MQSDPASAMREFFKTLGAPAGDDDALLAVDLMAAGQSIEDTLTKMAEQLTDPRDWAAREGLLAEGKAGPGDQEHGQPKRGDHQDRAPGDLAG